ncbi:MAG: 50S ribosomal protein L2 [Candidatus Micrarchaeota archaeon]|nr:50S ribosomal protein L2 [Candidatus Micrarchaeota archaeon]
MGKRLRSQRRGKGSPTYKSPSHRAKADVVFRTYDEKEKNDYLTGQITEFIDDPFHQALLMKVVFEDGSESVLIAPEGAKKDSYIQVGAKAELTLGGVMPLRNIPEGMFIYNIEKTPGDGGKLVRAPGSYGLLITKDDRFATIKLPSRKTIDISLDCRAQIGIISGGGIKELPLLKAGRNYYKRKAVNRDYPLVRGVAKNPVAHPFGGKEHHPGKSMSTARGAPPGRKVGHIGARRTGRKSK